MKTDLAIIGGGLAGLTLALQVRKRNPDLAITVLERRRHPVPEAAHKVGESTVEIGARYFAHDLALHDYLAERHLRKYGLRFFFGAGGRDISEADELGPSSLLPVPSYQVDRGRLENDLAQMARARDIAFHAGTRVVDAAISDAGGRHRIDTESAAKRKQIHARWVVDAASRASPLKRHLKLAKSNDHRCDAAWFRIDTTLRIDDWSGSADWRSRGPDGKRWLSTNHLMGPGYWVWLIPLASGATSIGIVADPALHPLESYNDFDKAMDWLRRHQPGCAQAIEAADAEVVDFLFLRHYSHDCRRVFSPDRWALTGEAGVFLDPFYSPGSDFIGIANTMICDLIERDLRGEPIDRRARQLEQVYFSFYRSTLSLYRDLYPGFGDRDLMLAKVSWDYAYYWSVLALLFCQGRIADLSLYERLLPKLGRAQLVNRNIQAEFRALAARRNSKLPEARFWDQAEMPLMQQLNGELVDGIGSGELEGRVGANVDRLERLAPALSRFAADGQAGPVLLDELGPGIAGV